ncbi:MAG: hypothetical protein ACI8R9_002002 [Paraglaciecola sp.]|jgi:hypothetical protein
MRAKRCRWVIHFTTAYNGMQITPYANNEITQLNCRQRFNSSNVHDTWRFY